MTDATSISSSEATRPRTRPTLPPPLRDQRLDGLRGLLQVFICWSHVEAAWAAFLIHKQLGFSDSSELFVFLSGFMLASVFERKYRNDGFRAAWGDLAARVRGLYVRHLVMVLAFLALVEAILMVAPTWAYLHPHPYAPMLADAGGMALAALLLLYQPPFLDVLPLFILLMLGLPAVMLLPLSWGWWSLAPSALIYLAVQVTGWSPVTVPDGAPWTFNPLAWQFAFCLGAYLGRRKILGIDPLAKLSWLIWPAAALVALGIPVRLSWVFHDWLGTPTLLVGLWDWMDKGNLSPLLLAHALSVALVAARLIPRGAAIFRTRWMQPLVWCGQRSLDVFIAGIFVSMLCSAALYLTDGAIIVHLLILPTTIVLLALWARLMGAR
ncbi:MAG: OpgC domain-containing protein [Alphaproteobacteria bacterium]|nr:OpgC domain-containing protein [Alphaproteobacteria bacterium]